MAKNEKMINPNLVSNLNYGYSLRDALISLVALFEKPFNHAYLINLFHNDNIFFVNHARTGLRLILNSIGLSKGSRVGVQAYNCYTVFNSIKASGMQPVFLDINEHFTIDVKDLEKKLNSIDCLIITHTFGFPVDIQEIREIFRNKPIIEDCAHSFLSSYNGQLTGTRGDAAIFSFSQGKFPSVSSGGYVIINSEYGSSFIQQFNKLKKHTIAAELYNIVKNFVISFFHKRPLYGIFTYPFLKKLNKQIDFYRFNQKESRCYKSNEYLFFYKSKNFKKYLKIQKRNALIILQYFQKTYFSNVNYFMIPLVTNNHEYIIQSCLNNGIEVGRHFNKALEWAKKHGYVIGSCPNTENLINNFVTLPCYYDYPPKKIVRYQNLTK